MKSHQQPLALTYRVDLRIFDLAYFRAQSKTVITAHELQFADGNTTSDQAIDDHHRTTTIYNDSYQHFVMEVNTCKTKVLNEPPPG